MVEEIGRVAAEVAARFRLDRAQVDNAVDLLKQGERVPFIARYRKHQTSGMKVAPLSLLRRQLDVDAARAAREARKLAHDEKKVSQAEKTPNIEHLLMKRIEGDSDVLPYLRSTLWEEGVLSASVLPVKKGGKRSKKTSVSQIKWREYAYDKAAIQSIPPRRLHMLFQGRQAQALSLKVQFKHADDGEAYLLSRFKGEPLPVIQRLWTKKILPALEVDTLARLRTRADDEMIYGIEKQLEGLLLTPKAPLGVMMGLYATRTAGLGVAVINEAGVVLDACTLFPLAQDFRWHDGIATLAKYIAAHEVSWVGIGNGVGLQETKRLLQGFSKRYPDMPIAYTAIDEAGLPRDVDALSGAISLARRFQNPLLELLQTPVEHMQFGDIQDEVNPKRLSMALAGVIEDTVSHIGVDLNTAPVCLLQYVPGLNTALAKSLVAFREAHGAFQSREALKALPEIDEKIFEQAAGFLRVHDGSNALDDTRLHPNDYGLLDNLDALPADERRSIESLRMPWRDPRAPFKQPQFLKTLKTIHDLKAGMSLEGIVTRITSFGAFIDVGIHQLGLLHISALAKRFVRDPHEVLHVGDVIRVHVLEVDVKNTRIAFGMKAQEKESSVLEISKKKRKTKGVKEARVSAPRNTAMADAFAKLKRGS